MSVGRRVARLRLAHGESLREAAQRTGISHTTIARLEKGAVTGSFDQTLRKIADGYGVHVQYLLTGADPTAGQPTATRRLSLEERGPLYFASAGGRLGLICQLLRTGPLLWAEKMASDLQMEVPAFRRVLTGESELTPQLAAEIPHRFAQTAGLSLLLVEDQAEDPIDALPDAQVLALVELARRAAQAGVQPDLLDVAIDLLTLSATGPRRG